jgi:small-conductance mechanosensitive channel
MRIIIIIIIIIINLFIYFCWWYQNFLHCKLAIDGTFPLSDMDSICGWYAANLILTILKSSPFQEKLIHLIIFTKCVIYS